MVFVLKGSSHGRVKFGTELMILTKAENFDGKLRLDEHFVG
jgi:hypothetical protein